MKTVVFDIDGTLADIEHRRPMLDGDRPNWAAFNAAMGEDTLNAPIVSLYRTLWAASDYDVIVVSGRNEDFRDITERWFVWNELPFDRLIMRKSTDHRADYLVKQDICDMLLAEGKQIEFVVDDRQQVVDMWRRNGITCLQCDVGDF